MNSSAAESVEWTLERVERLTELWHRGLSAQAIAEELGGFEHYTDKGRNAVTSKADRLGLIEKRKKKIGQSRGAEGNRGNASIDPTAATDAESTYGKPGQKLHGFSKKHPDSAFPTAGEDSMAEFLRDRLYR